MRRPVFARALFAALLAFSTISLAADGEERLDGIIAVVNKSVILQSDLDRSVDIYTERVRQRGQQLPDDLSFRRQVLSFLVETQVRLQEAEAIGIRVDESELNDTMRRIAGNQNKTLSEFRRAITAEGRDYRRVREEVRTELIAQRLLNREVIDRITVSQQEIDDYLADQAKSSEHTVEYSLQRILIAIEEGASPEAIAAAQAKATSLVEELRSGADFSAYAIQYSSGSEALSGGEIGSMSPANMPTIYADAVAGKPVGTVSDPLRTANGFHIIHVADKAGQKRLVVRQYRARHILLKSSAIRDENTTRDELASLRRRISLGDSFDDLARAHSEDPNSASQGGELPWVNPGEMTRSFDQVISSLEVGELSEPFRSPFGWHIVEVLERRDQDQTDERLAARAREAVRNRKAREEEELWIRRLRAEAYIEYRVAELTPDAAQ